MSGSIQHQRSKIGFGISYYGEHFPEHVSSDLEDIRGHGCTYIVLAASELDVEFYFDSLKSTVKEAHKIGLKVFMNLWSFGGAFGGEAHSRFLMEHPESRQVTEEGKAVAKACFNSRQFREFVDSTAAKCCRELGIDGFFIDEPHFSYTKGTESGRGCHCSECRRLFLEQFGRKMPDNEDTELSKFRNRSIVDFISGLSSMIKRIDPLILVTVCCLPREKVRDGVSWEDIASIGAVDVLSSDPYWLVDRKPLKDYVSRVSNDIVATARRFGKMSEVWIQIYKVPAGKEEEIYEAVAVAKAANPDFISAWTYRGAVGSALSSDNPDKCWRILGKAYRTE